MLSKAREGKEEVDGILESINLIPQLSVQDKETEENGKCPQNLQEMQESSPHTYKVTLEITIPNKADIDDGSLKERMNKDGVSLFKFKSPGSLIIHLCLPLLFRIRHKVRSKVLLSSDCLTNLQLCRWLIITS